MTDCGAVRQCDRDLGHRGPHSAFDVTPNRLTRTQYIVVRRFALGQTWERIMHDLGITRSTLHHHRYNALEAYGGGSIADLWRKLGWLVAPDVRRPH